MTKLRDELLEWLIVLACAAALVAAGFIFIGIPLAVILWILSRQGC